MCDVFLEPQETPFSSSITEKYLENTIVDQPADDSQSIICDIQIENERLRKEILQVTTLKENFKLEVEKLTHRISVQVPWSQRLSFILYWQILRRESLLNFFIGKRR